MRLIRRLQAGPIFVKNFSRKGLTFGCGCDILPLKGAKDMEFIIGVIWFAAYIVGLVWMETREKQK